MRLRSDLCAGTAGDRACSARPPMTRQPAVSAAGSEGHNQTPVQKCSEKWGCEVQPLCGEIGRWGSHALLDPVADASGAGVFLSPRPSRRNVAPRRAGCRARRPRPRRGRRSASPRCSRITPATIVGRAVGVQAGDVAALGERHARRGGRAASRRCARRQAVAVDACGVVGVELLQRSPRRRSRCRRRRSPVSGRARTRLRDRARRRSSARLGGERLRAPRGRGGSVLQVALGLAHDAGLGRDVEVDGRAPWPTTSSVEPPPTSMTSERCSSGRRRRGRSWRRGR